MVLSSPLPPHEKVPGLDDAVRTAISRKQSSEPLDILLTFSNLPYLSLMRSFLHRFGSLHGLHDVIVVELSKGVCDNLAESVPAVLCVVYPVEFGLGRYFTKSFDVLSVVKLEVAMTILSMGYPVLIVDTDIWFFRDPIPELRQMSATNDIVAQVWCRAASCRIVSVSCGVAVCSCTFACSRLPSLAAARVHALPSRCWLPE